MLRHLAIRHFAIISAVEIDIQAGFTAITGETGAGKSILVDALGLLLGDRAEAGLIAKGEKQAELEAVFELDETEPALAWLREQALDEGDELIIRRVLTTPSGSRAWINGRSATVGQLAELGTQLVEIHGQHEHQQLGRTDVQRRILDRQVDSSLIEAVEQAWSGWQDARESLEALERSVGNPDQIDLLRFQTRELEDLALERDEYEALEQEQERLARSDDIRTAIAAAAGALDSDEGGGARDLLHRALTALEPVRDVARELGETASMLEEARINIDEAVASLERLGSEESGDPERLDQVNRRLERALDLARKHRVQPEQLPELAQTLRDRLDGLDNQEERRRDLEARLESAESEWRQAAARLSEARQTAATSLSRAISARLADLGMDTARFRFEVEVDETARPAREGQDRIGILFSANPGHPPQPLSKVASGGELSRVALALMIGADRGEGPRTRIFDEVDAGVGGETAHTVGRFLKAAAGAGQAMCVTHLAQVAARADHQLRVRKERASDATSLQVETLDEDARRREIARMLGSSESEKSLAHAGELLAG